VAWYQNPVPFIIQHEFMSHLNFGCYFCFVVSLFGCSSGYAPAAAELPAYCTDPESIGGSRDLPPLGAADAARVSSLAQVQVLMRHGARIPWSAGACWRAYAVPWTDCRVHVLEAPSVDPARPANMQFRKVYDGTANEIPGTCQIGQLLFQGN
jgi:hypothetical protein